MLERLEELDRELFLWLNSPHSEFMDTVMWYISTTWLWIPIYLFFLYYAFKRGKWQFTVYVLLGILACVALADLLSVHAFKNVFMRHRPTHNSEIADIVKFCILPRSKHLCHNYIYSVQFPEIQQEMVVLVSLGSDYYVQSYLFRCALPW
jgi:undecaprenyl-diphosphatase